MYLILFLFSCVILCICVYRLRKELFSQSEWVEKRDDCGFFQHEYRRNSNQHMKAE